MSLVYESNFSTYLPYLSSQERAGSNGFPPPALGLRALAWGLSHGFPYFSTLLSVSASSLQPASFSICIIFFSPGERAVCPAL